VWLHGFGESIHCVNHRVLNCWPLRFVNQPALRKFESESERHAFDRVSPRIAEHRKTPRLAPSFHEVSRISFCSVLFRRCRYRARPRYGGQNVFKTARLDCTLAFLYVDKMDVSGKKCAKKTRVRCSPTVSIEEPQMPSIGSACRARAQRCIS